MRADPHAHGSVYLSELCVQFIWSVDRILNLCIMLIVMTMDGISDELVGVRCAVRRSAHSDER